MALAGRADTHVDELAGEGDGVGGVAPVGREAVVGAHGAEEGGMTGVNAVAEGAGAAVLEGGDEAGVDGSGGGDPLVVAAREAGGGVEPGPHDEARGEGEESRIGEARDGGFERSPGAGGLAAEAAAVPELAGDHVQGPRDGEESEVEGAAGIVDGFLAGVLLSLFRGMLLDGDCVGEARGLLGLEEQQAEPSRDEGGEPP